MSRRLTQDYYDADTNALLEQCMNIKSRAPVGKKIICEEQRRMEYLGEYVPLDSESSHESVDMSTSTVSTNPFSSPMTIGCHNNLHTVDKSNRNSMSMLERQALYFQDEAALNHFDIFKDQPPTFRVISGTYSPIKIDNEIEPAKNDVENQSPVYKDISSDDQKEFVSNETLSPIKEEETISDTNSYDLEIPRISAFNKGITPRSYERSQNMSDCESESSKKVRFLGSVLQYTISPNNSDVSCSNEFDSFSDMTEKPNRNDDKKNVFSTLKRKRITTAVYIKPRELVVPSKSKKLRRSSRVKVLPIRCWLSERAIYETASDGLQSLVDVIPAVLEDKMLLKHASRY